MTEARVVLGPRARRDLFKLQGRLADKIAGGLERLESHPWPSGKVKKLRGSDFREMRLGAYRAIFWPRGKDIAVLRIVRRRGLKKAIGRIDADAVAGWLEDREQ